MTDSTSRSTRGAAVRRAVTITLFLWGALPLATPPAQAGGLAWSTFLGGASTDSPYGVTVDAAGDIYVVGTTASVDFPITPGTIQTNAAVPTDVVVTKLRGDGATVLWSTYLGGSASEDGRAIAVDSYGNVYVTGNTRSADFPVTAGAFRTTYGGGISDAFVAKISPDGRRLLYSTYLGGDWDDYPRAIAVDGAGNAYVAGSTNSIDFPVTAGVVKPVRNPSITDGADGFVTKMNAAGSGVVWSTYFGSSGGTDNIFGLAVDGQGRPTLVGWTLSPGFPVTAAAFDGSFSNRREGFVTRLNASATGYVYSTLIGAEDHDECLGVAVDQAGSAYVTGKTASIAFPVTGGAAQASFGGGACDAFALKLSPGGDALLYSTYLGGTGADVGYAVAVNAAGEAVVGGSTNSAGFPITAGAYDVTANGGLDGFVTALRPDGGLNSSSFLGGSSDEDARFVRFQGAGHVIVAGGTASSTFPTTSGAFSRSHSGDLDDFVASVQVSGGTLSVAIDGAPGLLSLSPAWPNPHHHATAIRFTLARDAVAMLSVRDTQGRLVRTLSEGPRRAGTHVVTWDGRDEGGEPAPPGIYLVQLGAEGAVIGRLVARVR